MNKSVNWKVGLGLLTVFVAGAATGVVGTKYHSKRAFERALRFENWTADAMKELQAKLDLTPAQHTNIAAVINRTGLEIKSSFVRALEETGLAIVRSQRVIDQELNPGQREIHTRMKNEFRADLKKNLKLDLPPE